MTGLNQYEPDADDLEQVERQQEHEEQNGNTLPQDQEGHGSFNSALMMIFFLGSCGAALAMIPIMVSCKAQTSAFLVHVYDIIYAVDSFVVASLTLTCGFSLVRRRKWMADGDIKTITTTGRAIGPTLQNTAEPLASTIGFSHRSRSSRQSDQNSFPYTFVVFGIGSLLYRACQTIDTKNNFFMSSSFYSSTLYDNFHFVCDIFFSIGNIILVVFIVRFKYVSFRSCAYFHFFITLWIGGGLLLWFSVTLSPVYAVITESCYNASTFGEGNSTTAKEAVDTMLTFLKPFYVEFITICIGIFLTYWNKFDNHNTPVEQESVNDHVSTVNTDYLRFPSQDTNGHAVKEDTPESERLCGAQASNYTTITRLVIFIMPWITSLFYVILSITEHYVDENHRSNVSDLLNGIRVLFHLVLLIFFIPTCRAMIKNKLRFKPTSLACSEIVLIGTHTVSYVYFFFRFFAALSLLSSYESYMGKNSDLVFVMIYSGLCMLDTWCATFYILAMKSLQRSGRKMTNLDKFGLTYNAVIHLSEWAITSLYHEWAPKSSHYLIPDLEATFGDATVRLVTLVMYPMIDFYRFHAAVVCFEIGRDI